MTTCDSTTWLFIAIFAGLMVLIAVFVWGPALLDRIDWEPEHRTLDELERLPK